MKLRLPNLLIVLGSLALGGVSLASAQEDPNAGPATVEEKPAVDSPDGEEPDPGEPEEVKPDATDEPPVPGPGAEKPERPQGETPDKPAGDEPERPDKPAGDEPERPDKPAGDEPERPDKPAGDEPERPDKPAGDQPERPDVPSGDQPERPDVPSGDQPERPDVPNGDQPERPDVPSGDQPERPDKPNGDKPERPDKPNGDKPERPDVPNGDKPERPDVPSGDKPERPDIDPRPDFVDELKTVRDTYNQKREALREALKGQLAELGDSATKEQIKELAAKFRDEHAELIAGQKAAAEAIKDAAKEVAHSNVPAHVLEIKQLVKGANDNRKNARALFKAAIADDTVSAEDKKALAKAFRDDQRDQHKLLKAELKKLREESRLQANDGDRRRNDE